MEKLVVSKRDREVQEANRTVHDFGAENYEFYPPFLKKSLDRIHDEDAKYVRSLFDKKPKVLDAACGNGWLASSFYKAGCDLTINDISPNMVKVAKRRLRELGLRKVPSSVLDATDLVYGLAKKKKKFDVICFSSMLHHIYDYKRLLRIATECLNPGGVIYIIGEPQLGREIGLASRIVAFFIHNSINAYKALRRPDHLYRFLKEKFVNKDQNKGDVQLAEFHAEEGLDDVGLVNVLKKKNMRIVKFDLYVVYPFWIFNLTNWITRNDPKTFKLVAMKIK